MMKVMLVVLGVVVVGGCSLLPEPPVETRYALEPVPVVRGVRSVVADPSRTVRVDRPEVPLAYSGNQLVLVRNGEQAVYAGKGWQAPVPDMLQAALTRDLAAVMPGWVVAGESAGVRSAYELQVDVHTFATVQEGDTAAVVMNMDVRLLDPANRQVLKAMPYRYQAPLEALTTAQTLAAYNRGWRTLVLRIARLLH